MTITAKIVADSISNGVRLTTVSTKAPKFLDAEFEKHRMISSNSSSDRAIPLLKMLDNGYYLPTDIRLNQSGMQGDLLLDEDSKEGFWNDLKDLYGYTSEVLKKWDKVHKQHLNRYLMGFSWQNKVATATEWENFYNLRLDISADPAIFALAKCMKETMNNSEPVLLEKGEWHIPYINKEDCLKTTTDNFVKLSVARCARVSYLNHDNSTPTIEDDLDLYGSLVVRPYINKKGKVFTYDDPIHTSPTEHQATPMEITEQTSYNYQFPEIKGYTHMDKNYQFWSGNFRGWIQYRQTL